MIDYLVVGAGFAGAVAAERLASAGSHVELAVEPDRVGETHDVALDEVADVLLE